MSFRYWCCQKWFEHRDEIEGITGQVPSYTSLDYFGMYKWWLKREYRHEMKGEK